jgi:hypothetical protein
MLGYQNYPSLFSAFSQFLPSPATFYEPLRKKRILREIPDRILRSPDNIILDR